MTEDIVEFGATPARKPKRVRSLGRPQWLTGPMLPLAVAGAVCGAGSLILPWQRVVSRPEVESFLQPGPSREPYQVLMISLGAHASAYLLALIATCAVVAMIFLGHSSVPVATRVIGSVLSGANLVILAATALALHKGTVINGGYLILNAADMGPMDYSLDWGFYAALAAVVVLGVAALRAQPLPLAADAGESAPSDVDGQAGGEGQDDHGDGVIDLSVSVHPVGKRVAAG